MVLRLFSNIMFVILIPPGRMLDMSCVPAACNPLSALPVSYVLSPPTMDLAD